ncbi:MAG TPA: hypothetical protein VKC62_02890 [Gaiellaceae bacterium]|nr:hypothetical protein [Gaiellaceae bacterium]
MVLVLWIGGDETELARIGVVGCVHEVVDDGVLDVHVEVPSHVEARRIERALTAAGVSVERSWTFGGVPSVTHV